MVFSDKRNDSIHGILQIFDDFDRVSGLKINMEKSTIKVTGVEEEVCRYSAPLFI